MTDVVDEMRLAGDACVKAGELLVKIEALPDAVKAQFPPDFQVCIGELLAALEALHST
jgi:hypothetical protein